MFLLTPIILGIYNFFLYSLLLLALLMTNVYVPLMELSLLGFLIWWCVICSSGFLRKRGRIAILVGLGSIAFLSILGKITLLIGYQVNTIPAFCYISLITSSYTFLVLQPSLQYHWDFKTIPSTNFIIYFLFLIFLNAMGLYYSVIQASEKENRVFQVLFSLPVMSSSLEIYAILMGKLQLREDEVELEFVVIGTVVKEKDKDNEIPKNERDEESPTTPTAIFFIESEPTTIPMDEKHCEDPIDTKIDTDGNKGSRGSPDEEYQESGEKDGEDARTCSVPIILTAVIILANEEDLISGDDSKSTSCDDTDVSGDTDDYDESDGSHDEEEKDEEAEDGEKVDDGGPSFPVATDIENSSDEEDDDYCPVCATGFSGMPYRYRYTRHH